MSLKNLFVKESTEKEVPKKAPTFTSKPTPIVAGVNNINNPSVALVSAEETNEFTAFLDEVYQKGNFPGPDYQEFTDALKTLAGQQIPENIKFISVFAGLQVQGVTKARLLETAGKYIALINSQVTGFTSEINKKLANEIGGKQKTAESLLKENQEIDAQIAKLAEKKAKNAETILAINNEVNEETSSLNIKKASFEQAANNFINNVQSNIDKINTYLN